MKLRPVTVFMWGIRIILTSLFLFSVYLHFLQFQASGYDTKSTTLKNESKFPQISICPFEFSNNVKFTNDYGNFDQIFDEIPKMKDFLEIFLLEPIDELFEITSLGNILSKNGLDIGDVWYKFYRWEIQRSRFVECATLKLDQLNMNNYYNELYLRIDNNVLEVFNIEFHNESGSTFNRKWPDWNYIYSLQSQNIMK